jgi:hypothetical protein
MEFPMKRDKRRTKKRGSRRKRVRKERETVGKQVEGCAE